MVTRAHLTKIAAISEEASARCSFTVETTLSFQDMISTDLDPRLSIVLSSIPFDITIP